MSGLSQTFVAQQHQTCVLVEKLYDIIQSSEELIPHYLLYAAEFQISI